jgi:UDP-N-acetylmuramyl pentapeptide phosphotransferase/UDP-N-acetylglucosamine-1-phosphate transferase
MKELLLWQPLLFALVLAGIAAVLCSGLIAVLLPFLRRHLSARPNDRSSHLTPTPQGGGLPVIFATIVVSAFALTAFGVRPGFETIFLGLGALSLMIIGIWDDRQPISALPKLVLQFIVVAAVLSMIPRDMRLCSAMNLLTERALIAIALLWFINLVNFMDGLDWMTAVEVVPLTATLVIIGCYLAALPWEATVVASALCGSMLGFAPFNKPVARLFLGDTGSLPIGLLLGWCLLHLAMQGHLTTALLLPLYFLGDATVTLVRGLAGGRSVLHPHREHFYQRATDNGFTPARVAGEVFSLNVVLSGLAMISIANSGLLCQLALLSAGVAAVVYVLWRFGRQRSLA